MKIKFPQSLKFAQKFFTKILPVSISFFLISNYVAPLLDLVDFSVEAAIIDPIDRVDMDEALGSVHSLSGWSSADLPGNYGGCNGGTNCHYRQIVEETSNPSCLEEDRLAQVTLNAGSNYANNLRIRHLDGLANDGFNIYLNSESPANLIGSYTDSHSSETWVDSNFTLSNLTGSITLVFKATGSFWPSCPTYGQVAISWIEISGNTPPDTPINLGWNVASQSATPNETPLDLECSGIVYTNENSVAHNWSTVAGTNIVYQREVTYPNGSVGTNFYATNNYTPFSTFGGNPGTQGLWRTRVRAFEDMNLNGVYNDGIDVPSAWSNYCDITYDTTAPAKPVMKTIYKGHNPATWEEVGCDGFTNDTQISIEWYPSLDPDIEGYWFGTKFNDHHQYFSHPSVIKIGDMTPGNNPYWYTIIAVDRAGNESVISDPCGLTLDQTAPEVTWVIPQDGETKNGTINLTATCDGGESESQYVNFWWVKASEGQAVKVDNDKTNGDDDAFENNQYHYVRRGDPSTGTVVGNTFSWELDTTNESLKSPSYDWDGEWRLRAACKDAAGNYAHAEIDVMIDNTPPTSTVFIQGDLDETKDIVGTYGWHGYGWYESYDNINLQILVGDLTSDFINYQILPGDQVCPVMGDSGYTQVSHNANVAGDVNGSDGEYTLCYYAEDSVGNTESTIHKQILNIDNTAPEYTIDYNSVNGNEISGKYYINSDTMSVDIDVSDNLSGYTRARYDLYTADEDWNCTYSNWNQDNLLPPSTSTTRTLSVNGLSEGRYCLRIWAYDDVQNKSWWDTNGEGWVLFEIDITPPTADELDNQTYSEGDPLPTNQIVTGYDNVEIDRFCFNISGPHSSLPYSDCLPDNVDHKWNLADPVALLGLTHIDTSEIPEGTYTFEYWLFDLAGNESTHYDVDYTVENVTPNITLTPSNQTIDEGQTAYFDSSFKDPSYLPSGNINDPDDSDWSVEIDYGEGGGYQNLDDMDVPGDIEAALGNLQNVYENAGPYTVAVRVCEEDPEVNPDSEGECGVETVTVTVNNIVPVASISADPGTTVNEGTSVTLTANITSGNSPFAYNWGGDCSGSAKTTTVPSAAGIYHCSVTVTDVDGDTDTANITVTVNEVPESPEGTGAGEAVYGVVTSQTGNINGDGATDESSDEEENEEDEGEVLGEEACEETTKVSGYIYYDQNENGEKDEGEEALSGVTVIVYQELELEGEEKVVATVDTDENGYWESEVCPGDYKVKLEGEDLPDNVEYLSDEVRGMQVGSDDLNDINFRLKKEGFKFSWWWCLAPIALAFFLVLLTMLLKRREEKGPRSF